MKLTSLIVLLAIVGGVGYVLVFKRDWLSTQVKKGSQALEGYTPAKSPRDAMELFMKAIKKRNYDAAANYCSGDYEDKLRKAHDGARELGTLIDDTSAQIDEKGFKKDKTTFVLYHLDPFPNNFKIGDIKEDKKDSDKAIGYFVLEPLDIGQLPPQEAKDLDIKMFTQCLRNPVVGPNPIKPAVIPLEIKAVEKDGEKHWLINAPMLQINHEQILYFVDHYKSYISGMAEFKNRLRQGRYLRDQVFPELVDVLRRSK